MLSWLYMSALFTIFLAISDDFWTSKFFQPKSWIILATSSTPITLSSSVIELDLLIINPPSCGTPEWARAVSQPNSNAEIFEHSGFDPNLSQILVSEQGAFHTFVRSQVGRNDLQNLERKTGWAPAPQSPWSTLSSGKISKFVKIFFRASFYKT